MKDTYLLNGYSTGALRHQDWVVVMQENMFEVWLREEDHVKTTSEMGSILSVCDQIMLAVDGIVTLKGHHTERDNDIICLSSLCSPSLAYSLLY